MRRSFAFCSLATCLQSAIARLAPTSSNNQEQARERRRALTAWPKIESLSQAAFSLAALLSLAATAPANAQTFVPNWVQLSPATSPPGRQYFAMAYDAAHGQVVLFGGASSSYFNDTWVWDGTSWTEEFPATSPSARFGSSMAYDAAHGQVVLFGGQDVSGYLNDTWVWDGSNWTEESPASSPPARYVAAMAYDAAHGQVVLFGGDSNLGLFDDTWVWDGTNWTEEGIGPSARLGQAMAYDAAHGQVVLFGGSGDGGSGPGGVHNDTWVWNGTNWTEEFPSASPPPRVFPAMDYDGSQGQVVLFGGYDNCCNVFNDTWVWNGTNWTQESPAASPSARWASGIAYDVAHGQVVLVGGYIGSGVSLDDTWVYGGGYFGSVSIGTTSAAQSLNFQIPGGTTVGSIGVLTQGAANLDFTDAGGDTCAASTYASPTNCTVNVQFAPKFAGPRMGAVVFKDGSGNLLSTTYISGIGSGPQIAFEPSAYASRGGGFTDPEGVAADASGNVYVADFASSVVNEMPAGCANSSCVSALGGGFSGPTGVAVDGSGNVYIADSGNNAVKEMPAGCASSSCVTTLGGGFSNPDAVAVDGSGNVYVADANNNAVEEMPPGCASSTCVTALGGGFASPHGVAVDGSGNVYVANFSFGVVNEMPPGCASSSCVTTLGGGFNHPAGVAVDGAGNVYVADRIVKEMPAGCATVSCVTVLSGPFKGAYGVALDGAGNVYVVSTPGGLLIELNAAAPHTLGFPTATAVGSTDNVDGTLTEQVFNIGNMPLVFSALAYAADFVEASDTNPCTSTTSLSAGQECDVPVEFAPQVTGSPLSENVTLTDNNLNGTGVQQSIPLSGTAEEPAAATMISPSAKDGPLTAAATTFTWNQIPAGATAYYLWIGTTPGGYDIANLGPFTGTSATVTLPTNGTSIYVRLWTFFNGGAIQLYNDYTYTELSYSAGTITSPANGSTLTSSTVTFTGSGGSGGTLAYYLWVGTTPGGYDLANIGPFTGIKVSANLPTNGATIYVRLWTFINGGATQLENDYTYTEAGPAVMTSPANGSTLLSASTTFNWSAGPSGPTTYYLWVGTSPGAADLINMGPISGTTATVTLPTNGTPIYVRLWTFINGGATQLENDYTYTEAILAAAAITSPANNSTLLSASTTFNWSPGSGGALTYYLWAGSTPGAADLANIGPLTSTSVTVTLPTNGIYVFVRLWTFINGGATQLENDYTFVEATLAPGVITSPANGSTLALGPTTFSWNAGSGGVTAYYLWVGSSPGAADVANIGPISGTTATVNLPTNGTPIYVRLWTFINGGTTQLENDYGYTEAGP